MLTVTAEIEGFDNPEAAKYAPPKLHGPGGEVYHPLPDGPVAL
jgi:hypothetical protein